MKRLLFLVGIAICPTLLVAQEQEVRLSEVEIQAASVIETEDGRLIYPSEAQTQASTSSYNLLERLALPNLRIDETSHSVSVIDQRGGVQIRINGIPAGVAEMLTLNPKSVSSIKFIDNPGVRYGDDIAYVINIITLPASSGYTVGVDLKQGLNVKCGSDMLYAKWNRSRSEVKFDYRFDYNDTDGEQTREETQYHLYDGSIHSLLREDMDSRSRTFNHHVGLTFNWSDSSAHVLQLSLSSAFSNTPGDYKLTEISEESLRYEAQRHNKETSSNPVLDLYFYSRITERQSFTINMVGTSIYTSSNYSYNEGEPYHYDVDGRTWSLISEAIYENRLKPFTLSAGINYRQKYTHNEYSGDVYSFHPMRNSSLYGFTEIKGFVGRLRYSAGLGATHLYYRQGSESYNFSLFRPKLSLSYRFSDTFQLLYSVERKERFSRIAMISDISIRKNSWEWTQGNPALRPTRDFENSLRLSYHQKRLQFSIEGFYRACHRPNMAHYERTDDNRFIYTQRNQKEIDVLNLMIYANYWLIPDQLSIMTNGSLLRCFNFGDNYTHCYTTFNGAMSLNAYLGSFSLSAYADNGFRFLEGETKGHNGYTTQMKGSYQKKGWNFTLSCLLPFARHYREHEAEILNTNLHKNISIYNRDLPNRLSLHISYRLSRGRTYRDIDRSIRLEDKDTGIIQ